MQFKPQGVCAQMMNVELEGDIIKECSIVGGCNGNTQGVCALVKGMKAQDAINRMKGIKCGFKATSCPDQLAIAIEKAMAEQ